LIKVDHQLHGTQRKLSGALHQRDRHRRRWQHGRQGPPVRRGLLALHVQRRPRVGGLASLFMLGWRSRSFLHQSISTNANVFDDALALKVPHASF
jgi:hypothetical protein